MSTGWCSRSARGCPRGRRKSPPSPRNAWTPGSASCASAGIAPNAVCSEADGTPDIPATLVLIIEGERIVGRKPGQAPFVFEGMDLPQVLALVLARKPDEPELHHVRVFTDAAGRARFADGARARWPVSSRAPT